MTSKKEMRKTILEASGIDTYWCAENVVSEDTAYSLGLCMTIDKLNGDDLVSTYLKAKTIVKAEDERMADEEKLGEGTQ